MTETILAGKQVKKFAAYGAFIFMTSINAIFTWFFKNFFVRYRPGNTRYGDGYDEKRYNLSG